MASSEERMKILKMIEDGKLSVEEGTKLLAALREACSDPPRPPGMPGGPRWLRIRVTDVRTGRSKASVQIPLALVDADEDRRAFRAGGRRRDMSNVMGGADRDDGQNY